MAAFSEAHDGLGGECFGVGRAESVLLAIGLGVGCNKGPVFFLQERIGWHGKHSASSSSGHGAGCGKGRSG